jgi:aspartyl-tRNA(Asn)/glutamyl-tRNA(Gln) amidotransferase subunit A
MRDPLEAAATAADISAAVRAGSVTAREVVEAALARIERANPTVNAFTAVAAERARERADGIDAARRAGAALGELAGVPFGVKAMVDVAGLTTTGGSALFRDAPVATRDAAVVRKLEAAGAVCVGAQNMDELGMGGTTDNACFGPTRNPHDRSRTPGGSSGGSAAAVAAGMVPLSIGSDGLGSVRLLRRCAACSDCDRHAE